MSEPVSDAAIEKALADTDVDPQLVSWHGTQRIVLRVEVLRVITASAP